jgi:TonB family protein
VNIASEIGKSNASPATPRRAERAQSRRMLFALILLMIAIAVVAYRDREFLFEAEPGTPQQAASSQTPTPAAQVSETKTSSQSVAPSNADAIAPAQKAATVDVNPSTPAMQTVAPVVAPKAKSPRQVAAKPAAPVVRKEASVNSSAAAVTAQAAQRSRVAEVTVVQEPSTALFPRLDQRTKVEGSVELQALVGTDGSIQELHVMRGPAVLGSAAREAVMQWKFKPYTQNGVPVETYARITVNFTIKVVDGSPKTVASVEPEHVIILADNYQR